MFRYFSNESFTLFKEFRLTFKSVLLQSRGKGFSQLSESTLFFGELGSMKSLSCREVDDYLNSSFRVGRKARGS